jgi:hypothetical protein
MLSRQALERELRRAPSCAARAAVRPSSPVCLRSLSVDRRRFPHLLRRLKECGVFQICWRSFVITLAAVAFQFGELPRLLDVRSGLRPVMSAPPPKWTCLGVFESRPS